MKLNAPRKVAFIISVVFAALSLLAQLGLLSFLPAYWMAMIAWVIIVAACVMKGF